MTEPGGVSEIGPDPPEDAPGRRRLWPMVLAILGFLVVAALTAILVLSRPGPTFETLLTATEAAETDRLWFDYFMAQDCFATAVLELGNPDIAYQDGLDLLDQTDRMSAHVTASLNAFDDVTIRGWHGEIAGARDAIAAHYLVWDQHLQAVDTILVGLSDDIPALAVLFDDWLDEVIEAGTPIEETYNEANEAFLTAAPDEDYRQDVERIFTPTEITCSRGAV
ncbi:MAG TPA: hypothetical protein VM470_07630 [Acidimicrobiia bacterium]|nr:hypothetical protein [Acidimicrobiia bacterium]